MGRNSKKLNLQHKAEELKRHYQKSQDAVERRRIQVVWLLAEGQVRENVQAITAYSDWSMRDIISRYNKDGLLGLKNKCHNNYGAPTLLNQKEQLLLAQTLEKPPIDGGRWSGKKVAAWVKENLDRKISLKSCYNYLHHLGFSLQRPRPRHKRVSSSEQELFKKNTYQKV